MSAACARFLSKVLSTAQNLTQFLNGNLDVAGIGGQAEVNAPGNVATNAEERGRHSFLLLYNGLYDNLDDLQLKK